MFESGIFQRVINDVGFVWSIVGQIKEEGFVAVLLQKIESLSRGYIVVVEQAFSVGISGI